MAISSKTQELSVQPNIISFHRSLLDSLFALSAVLAVLMTLRPRDKLIGARVVVLFLFLEERTTGSVDLIHWRTIADKLHAHVTCFK
jgi:hypothetical protein